MSFLDQLKSQASALQTRQHTDTGQLDARRADAEAACLRAWSYLSDLSRQLDVLQPVCEGFTLDGKTYWPAMKLSHFRVDFRKKKLRDREVYDYLAMGWKITPHSGEPVTHSVSVNFPPELQRVEARLADGNVRHERNEVRHPEKNSLLAVRFDCVTESRGSVQLTPAHDAATLAFRIANAGNFGIVQAVRPASAVHTDVLDEMARLVVGQSHRFF